MEQDGKNLINSKNKMKYIVIVIAILLFFQPSYSQDRNMINEIEKITNNNIYFYVGNIGVINKDLFIKKNDANNAIYSKSFGTVFKNDTLNLNNIQIVKIKQKDEKVSFKQVDSIDADSLDLFVVFSKKAIYIIDFSSKKFGKYMR